jgi:hypothetical protein
MVALAPHCQGADFPLIIGSRKAKCAPPGRREPPILTGSKENPTIAFGDSSATLYRHIEYEQHHATLVEKHVGHEP